MQEEPQRNQFSPQVYFLFCVTSGPIRTAGNLY